MRMLRNIKSQVAMQTRGSYLTAGSGKTGDDDFQETWLASKQSQKQVNMKDALRRGSDGVLNAKCEEAKMKSVLDVSIQSVNK